MNSNFIQYSIGNIFSEVIPIADTYFHLDDVRISPPFKGVLKSNNCVVCTYPLELSWVFNMVLNIYYDELNDKNRPKLVRMMVRNANHYIEQGLPKQAVLFGVMVIAEKWFKKYFPNKAKIIIENENINECLQD